MPKEELTFDEEHLLFYEAIGKAITAWSEVEIALCAVGLTVVKKSDEPAITVGFFAIESFRSKLQFISELVCLRYGTKKRIFEDWLAMQTAVSGLSTKRNHLAHWPIIRFPKADQGRRIALTTWLVPNRHKPLEKPEPAFARDKPISSELCLRNIISFEMEFVAIKFALWSFVARLRKQIAPVPANYAQPQSPPEIRKLADHLHARLGHPRLSSREKRRLTETVAE